MTSEGGGGEKKKEVEDEDEDEGKERGGKAEEASTKEVLSAAC